MTRLVFLFLLFVVGIGIFTHLNIQIPYLQWIGHLPGDLVVHKGSTTIYFPLTTSIVFSALLSVIFHQRLRR